MEAHVVHERFAVACLDQEVIVDARVLKIMTNGCSSDTCESI